MPRILVIGSSNIDLISTLNRLPKPGETLAIDQIQMAFGGKGANAAVAAARLGAEVTMVGCVGEDDFGPMIRRSLEAEGVNCTHLRSVPGGSGMANILLQKETRQNSIMIAAGANAAVTLPDDPGLFRAGDTLLLQLEIPMPTVLAAARQAKAAGMTVILDPAPAPDQISDELLALCDFLTPNETELATLTGLPTESPEQIVAAAKVLLQRGVSHVVTTRGGEGATLLNAGHYEHFAPYRITPIDTTAAGDTFTAALGVFLAEGDALNTAIEGAIIAGALACTKLGAQPSLPYRQAVQTIREALSGAI